MSEFSGYLNFTIEKTAAEIKGKCGAKIEETKKKIDEKQARLAKLRQDYAIDDAAFIQILTTARKEASHGNHPAFFNYSATLSNMSVGVSDDGPADAPKREERTIGAGPVQFLLTESDAIESAKANVEFLELLVRNLRPLVRIDARVTDGQVTEYEEDAFPMTYHALEMLGF